MMLESMGISVEFSHHEGAPGQQEIDLRYADALTTADNIMSFRLAMKEVALDQGVYASFMPKPFTEHPGSGMHTHMSLFEGDRNVFYEPGAEFHLSKLGRAFIAGLLTHAAEITAVCNQWVNSYKRLWGGDERIAAAGGEAPAYICWGHNNRSALVRVPMYKPQKGNATRIEFRSIDPACNPYLAFAVILAAGLKGIEADYELPPGAEDDVWALTSAERRALGIAPLPQSLSDACDVMQSSELVAETLGEHVFDFFLRNKRAEWRGVQPPGHRVRAGPVPARALTATARVGVYSPGCRPRCSRCRYRRTRLLGEGPEPGFGHGDGLGPVAPSQDGPGGGTDVRVEGDRLGEPVGPGEVEPLEVVERVAGARLAVEQRGRRDGRARVGRLEQRQQAVVIARQVGLQQLAPFGDAHGLQAVILPELREPGLHGGRPAGDLAGQAG